MAALIGVLISRRRQNSQFSNLPPFVRDLNPGKGLRLPSTRKGRARGVGFRQVEFFVFDREGNRGGRFCFSVSLK